MRPSYYFYDLETSGLNPRGDRIMQFAGMRTDMDFRPLGDPVNLLIEMPNDTLPSPTAIMVTGITPQACNRDGISEREFCRFIVEDMAAPNTVIVGYNSVRFDDEFMRSALWRNFHDPYAWQWRNKQSRWDLLDVVRMTRALRPEGIEWPVTEDGHATNRLELITKLNGIAHEHAHDALSDVEALIAVTKLIREKQPQLFDYLFNMRLKRMVKKLVNPDKAQPFVYSSGRYPSEFEKTTVAYPIAKSKNDKVLVFDLRYDVNDLLATEKEREAEIEALMQKEKGLTAERAMYKVLEGKPHSDIKHPPFKKNFFPIVKQLQYNRCPAVAPIGVLEKNDGWKRIGLTKLQIEENLEKLLQNQEFLDRVIAYDEKYGDNYQPAADPESALYNGFLGPKDQTICAAVRSAGKEDMKKFHPHFEDERLAELLLHYKGKYYPASLNAEETAEWEKYRTGRLNAQMPKFTQEMQMIQGILAKNNSYNGKSAEDCGYLLEELSLWYQSLLPEDL